MTLKLKICGMKYPENIQDIAALNPDYMGFIFYEKTPRFFNTEIPKIQNSIKKTGVFVKSKIAEILDKINKYDLNAIQLHGGESAEFCAELKLVLKETSIEIIKVFSVKSEFDFNQLADFEDHVDYFLFDTKGKHKGGNGETFDWTLLKEYPSEKPFFLKTDSQRFSQNLLLHIRVNRPLVRHRTTLRLRSFKAQVQRPASKDIVAS